MLGQLPTGPLWGRGRSATAGAAAALEHTALAPHRALCDELEHAGLRQDRRALVLEVRDLEADYVPAQRMATVSFTLPAGAYATVWLEAAFNLTDAALIDE